ETGPMTSPSRQKKGAFAFRPSLARLLTTKRLLARIVLFFEQLLPPLMPVLSVVAFYLSAIWRSGTEGAYGDCRAIRS
ncbi:hypothetical protein, partial [Rhizobium johnstonii]|uniref:hypothetical protein n=1 Tax=Rhizobium johnstonii TaxID=3019933 RepID=UPI003F9B6E27